MASAAASVRIVVSGAGSAVVNGAYARRDAGAIPAAFARVCLASGWAPATTWSRLNGPRAWWEAANESYIYLNRGDAQWWLDSGETGLGLYVSRVAGVGDAPAIAGWELIGDGALPLPSVSVVQDAEL